MSANEPNKSPPTPNKRPTMKDIAAQRKARYEIETGHTSKGDYESAAKDYIEKEKIKRDLEEEKRKFDVTTDIAIARADQRTKTELKNHYELVNKRVDEDKIRREEEAIQREQQLARIRQQKEEQARIEHEKRLARQQAIAAGTYQRQPTDNAPFKGGVGTVSGAPIPPKDEKPDSESD